MDGTGGAGGSGGSGIDINGTNTLVTAGNGSIDLTGTGGAGAGQNNVGIVVGSDAAVTSTGTATIALTGTGDAVAFNNQGILITGTGTNVTSVSGQITLTGTPDGNIENRGIHITDEGTVVSTTSASIALNTPLGDLVIEELGNVDSQGSGGVTSNIQRDLRVLGSAVGATPAYINLTNGAANLTINRNVIVTGGTGIGSEAQIGNRGAPGSATADITIDTDQLLVEAQASSAIIGHGLPSTVQNLSGDIDLVTRNIFVVGDSAPGQIGHVNATAGGSTLGGDILLSASNNIEMTGGTAAAGYARIGLGGQAGAATYNLSEVLLIAGVDIIMTTSSTGEAQIVNESGPLTIVTDDAFPASPGIGPGGFSIGVNGVVSASP